MVKAATFLAALTLLVPAVPGQTTALIPSYKYVQTLVASTQLEDKTYPMVPILLRLGPTDLLVGYKRGYSHSGDREADFEILRINPLTERIESPATDLHAAGLNFQDGEFARFANGEIACYVDIQAPGGQGAKRQTVRMGLREYRSKDGGRSFRDMGKVGVIDGVEYGYAFEAVTTGQTTYMLVMTFTNLPGGKKVSASAPQHAGSVDVIRSDDNGRSWHFVRNLSQEFGGLPINESSFVPYGDGFLVAARGYGNHQWVERTDSAFRLQKQVELNTAYPFIRSYVGRPRIFEHEGSYYLLGRNWPQDGPMKLSLFRLEPQTLTITKHVILDNAENEKVVDGYYAVPYWQERDGRSYLNVITYKRMLGRLPDIIRLEFDWNEVR
ncbi:MAG TPA: sialidase family protein [Bryobacteraceae bacterium]|jgi:hypothetical protein|nr:sialidase family protein [Bryobacteraceae bacterium]